MGKFLDIQNNKQSEYAQCVNSMLHLAQQRQIMPWLWPDWIYQFSSMKREQDKYLRVLHGFTQSVIKEKQKEKVQLVESAGSEAQTTKKKCQAFLDILLTVKTADGKHLTNADLQEEVDTFMFEGHDTTACALSWTLLLLANHPEVQAKIIAEQQQIFSADPDGDVVPEHLSKMTYLEACVKEALRLYPSVPIIGRRVAEDFFVDGKLVPKDATIVISPMLLHRNSKIWRDPDAFIPERFIPGTR